MLDSADLLVAVLEPDASGFSAPSKVLTYLAAGKAILAAVARDNPAAEVIRRAGAGVVVDPRDARGLVAAARQLLADPARLRAAGAAGRAFAREAFDIGRISERFEAVVYEAVNRKSPSGLARATDTGQADTSREARP
jgi:glycosyltransferase involved in cell wall biosynthesis